MNGKDVMKVNTDDRVATGLVLAKLRSGDSISDADLNVAINVLSFIVPILRAFGDRYALATTDLQQKLNQLEDFNTARQRG